jgi:hypothetical protein
LRRTDLDSITPQDAARRFNVSTYDDDTTQAAIRFLLAAVDACAGADGPRGRRIRAACDHALAKLLEAQLPCGAWPQRYDGIPRGPAEPPRRATIPADWPREWPKDRYERLATLNDDVQLDCIETLRDAHRRRGDPVFITAIRRAGDFLVAAQLPEPQPGWAQQYDERMHGEHLFKHELGLLLGWGRKIDPQHDPGFVTQSRKRVRRRVVRGELVVPVDEGCEHLLFSILDFRISITAAGRGDGSGYSEWPGGKGVVVGLV